MTNVSGGEIMRPVLYPDGLLELLKGKGGNR